MSQSTREVNPVAAWVLACRNADGGFGSFPGDISALRPTRSALDVLHVLGIPLAQVDRTAEYVQSHQGSDGGFHGRPWGRRWTLGPTLADSYHAMCALQGLGRLLPRPQALADFVVSRQREDGAFLADLGPNGNGTCAETSNGVKILRGLGPGMPRSEATVAFLGAMQRRNVRSDGGFVAEDSPEWADLSAAAEAWASSRSPYRDPPPEDTEAVPVSVGYTQATYAAIAALAVLDGAAPDPRAAASFLASQQHSSGGFVTGLGAYGAYRDRSEGRMSDTYSALLGLRLLSEAVEVEFGEFAASLGVEVNRCSRWIVGCQNADGGFARRADPVSRPSDMTATAQAVFSLKILGRPMPRPERLMPPILEELPAGVTFGFSTPYFQPEQPGQALFLYRIVEPIRKALRSDEAVAIDLMRWTNEHLGFMQNWRDEAALIIEDGYGTCGGQSRCLAGLLTAAGIPARFLTAHGHCACEAFLDGRWCLLDAMFQGAFRRADGQLCSAFDVHQHFRQREPRVTTFGDWRYERFTVHWPGEGSKCREITIGPKDTAASPGVQEAYPELAG